MQIMCRVLLYLSLLLCLPVWAAENENLSAPKAGTSGLPLPRFASLRSDEVNMRTGPGTRYPIEWVYRQEGLPVEIVAEFDVWRRVRDWEGTEGWIQKANLIGKRSAIITAKAQTLRAADDNQAKAVAQLEQGALGQILRCAGEWCQIKFGDIKGYLRKADFWGVYSDERLN